ncbi:phage holin family protein [Streptomyces montanisoli]|uniref:Phage holin family protein n=1 Tax=Streptomyces montanisoli TaxID=2798581 RepID=A0A940RU47_9ACTN|nr:phage holin family protein [Streptomyces montanisoli]MBP0456846.1 phage holin family protein [Streptomyces montanisoli]
MPQDSTRETGARLGDAAARLTEDTTELVRQQIGDMRQELLATVRRTGTGLIWLGGAAVCGVFTVSAVYSWVLRELEKTMPPARAAATLGVICAGGAAGLGLLGARQLRDVAVTSQEAARHARADGTDEAGEGEGTGTTPAQ